MRMAAQCRLLFVLHHFGLCPSQGFPPPFPTVGKGNGGTVPRKARNCNGLRALSVVLSAPTPGPFPGWWREVSYRTAPHPRASVCARGQSPRARQRTRSRGLTATDNARERVMPLRGIHEFLNVFLNEFPAEQQGAADRRRATRRGTSSPVSSETDEPTGSWKRVKKETVPRPRRHGPP